MSMTRDLIQREYDISCADRGVVIVGIDISDRHPTRITARAPLQTPPCVPCEIPLLFLTVMFVPIIEVSIVNY